jgi:GTP-binding protein
VRARWLELMEHYVNVRESLVGLVLIVDSRRGLGAQDAAMLEWVLARDRQAHVLLTKADKLNRRDGLRVLKETRAACSDTAVTAQLFSAYASQGLEEARGVMDAGSARSLSNPPKKASPQKKASVEALKQPPRQMNPAWG